MRRLARREALLLCAALGGCRKVDPDKPRYLTEQETTLKPVVAMADIAAAGQLVSGFHGLEAGAWRWTGPKFSVALQAPQGAGLILFADYTVPAVFLERIPQATLSIRAGGIDLEPEAIRKEGRARLERNLPEGVLANVADRSLLISFSLDRFLTAGQADSRDLGLIVSTIGVRAATPAP